MDILIIINIINLPICFQILGAPFFWEPILMNAFAYTYLIAKPKKTQIIS